MAILRPFAAPPSPHCDAGFYVDSQRSGQRPVGHTLDGTAIPRHGLPVRCRMAGDPEMPPRGIKPSGRDRAAGIGDGQDDRQMNSGPGETGNRKQRAA